jgi:AcrR family transcriptional regulator
LRNRILATATEEMAVQGIKFTMSDLAQRLAVSKRTLYEYFDSKEEIISTIVDQFLNEIRQQGMAVIKDDGLSMAEKIKRFQVIYPLKRFDPLMSRILDDIMRYLPEEQEKINRFREEEWSLVKEIINKGVEAKYFRPVDPAVIKMLFNGISDQLSNYKYLSENNLNPKEATSIMVDLLFNGLLEPEKRDESV